jgi:hypothetical protein
MTAQETRPLTGCARERDPRAQALSAQERWESEGGTTDHQDQR